MNIEAVEQRVAEIIAKADDDEVAHSLEDDLHQDVLASIGLRSADPESKALALAALATLDIQFSRWCA